ncbi:MAG: hypothetical protein WDN46_17225 [Methylocella sp.]
MMMNWVDTLGIAPEAVWDSFVQPQPRLAVLLNELWHALAIRTWRDLIGGEPFYWGA